MKGVVTDNYAKLKRWEVTLETNNDFTIYINTAPSLSAAAVLLIPNSPVLF